MKVAVTDPKEWVIYNPETGKFTYKVATADMFGDGKRHMTAEARAKVWNTKNAEREAGSVDGQGYVVMCVGSKIYKAHRLAFLLMTGEMPKGQVDHINGDRADNRWENLRDVPKLLNALNQKRHSTNKSGVTGVRFAAHTNKWMAYIGHDNRMHHLGVFDTLEEAAEARWEAEEQLGFHESHGRR
jgi:hypothetical protein